MYKNVDIKAGDPVQPKWSSLIVLTQKRENILHDGVDNGEQS